MRRAIDELQGRGGSGRDRRRQPGRAQRGLSRPTSRRSWWVWRWPTTPAGGDCKFLRRIPDRSVHEGSGVGASFLSGRSGLRPAGAAATSTTSTPARRARPSTARSTRRLVSERWSLTRSCRGWTLIELTIVISLVTVLSTLALVGYRSAITRSREAVLKEDLFRHAGRHRPVLCRPAGVSAHPRGPGDRRIPARHPARALHGQLRSRGSRCWPSRIP